MLGRQAKRIPPIFKNEKAFTLNATVVDAAFDDCKEESPRFFVGCCYCLRERARECERESMNLLQSMNAFMQQKTPPCLLKYCKLTQYVICATRGLSVTTIKTKYVVWWRLDVVCDHGSCCLYCWTATKFNEILSDVTQAEIMFRLCLVTFLDFLPLTLWSMIFILSLEENYGFICVWAPLKTFGKTPLNKNVS